MTRTIRQMAVGAVVAALALAPLGMARADTISGAENGFSLSWVVPTVSLPSATVTVNGQPYTVGGDNAIGGTLTLAFDASEWAVSHGGADCPAGQVGSAIALAGRTPDATLNAIYTPLSGEATTLEPEVVGRYPTFTMGFCA